MQRDGFSLGFAVGYCYQCSSPQCRGYPLKGPRLQCVVGEAHGRQDVLMTADTPRRFGDPHLESQSRRKLDATWLWVKIPYPE